MEDFNHWSEMASAFDEAISQVIRKTAFDWQANMQAMIRANNQIDTGFMINSVYVRTNEESTYATSAQPIKPGQKKLDEVEAPPDKYTAYIGVGAAYGFWQNYGTTRIPARPFVEPSKELTRPPFELAMARIEEKLRTI